MYMAPACTVWLLLGVALLEWPRMVAEGALGLIAAKPLLYGCAAAMGFGVNALAYIVIQLASSLTLKARAGDARVACGRRVGVTDAQGACGCAWVSCGRHVGVGGVMWVSCGVDGWVGGAAPRMANFCLRGRRLQMVAPAAMWGVLGCAWRARVGGGAASPWRRCCARCRPSARVRAHARSARVLSTPT